MRRGDQIASKNSEEGETRRVHPQISKTLQNIRRKMKYNNAQRFTFQYWREDASLLLFLFLSKIAVLVGTGNKYQSCHFLTRDSMGTHLSLFFPLSFSFLSFSCLFVRTHASMETMK